MGKYLTLGEICPCQIYSFYCGILKKIVENTIGFG